MEISLLSDTATTIATAHGLGFANFLTDRLNFTVSSSDQHQQLQISALIFPIDAVAPPPVKPRVAPKTLARKRSRVRRRSKIGSRGADDGEDGGGYFGGGGGDGPFGGGGGSGGNYDGFNWDESSAASPSDPAFDFIYEVLCWIVFSNCLHFAFKKVVRILADGVADPGREKVPLRFAQI